MQLITVSSRLLVLLTIVLAEQPESLAVAEQLLLDSLCCSEIAMSEYESPFRLIDLSYGGRTRPSQLNTANIARAFQLIPDTIILVSERNTVALPQDGAFYDCYTWIVEGEANMSVAGGGPGTTAVKGKGPECWKPQAFPPALSKSSGHVIFAVLSLHVVV